MNIIETIAGLPLNENERESPPGPPESHTDAVVQTVSDNERLIQALETGFSSLLRQQQEICQAIADLKPKPPTPEKKTAFWNGYMALANEYDKEFLQKYGTDLDTSLIFAGLFSAVASAFIIQIQPEFESSPHPLTVISQSLLYTSLGSTLLAALLAVLGKQWLMYYSAAGERGTVEARGLERQRKLNGLEKWRFELIMQAFPLLLQFGLFLFASALSVYLWRIHCVLAGIVLGITAGGTTTYFTLLSSGIFFKDSPFQTPLAPFFRAIGSYVFTKSLRSQGRALYEKCTLQSLWMCTQIKRLCSNLIDQSRDLLPMFILQQTAGSIALDSDQLAPLFVDPVMPSPEVSGVSWVLKTSTDPTLLAQAADMSIDLQWPVDLDLQPYIQVMQEMFLSCFEYTKSSNIEFLHLNRLRDGMSSHATQFGQGYIIMQCLHKADSSFPPDIDISHYLFNTVSSELATVLSIISDYKSPRLTEIPSQPWLMRALHFKLKVKPWPRLNPSTITYLKHRAAELDSGSSLTCSTFSEYLFVVYFCLVDGNITANDMRVKDKSAYEVLLYEKILKTLPSKLESEQTDMQLRADILKLTLQLTGNCEDHKEWDVQWRKRQTAAYQFCQALPQTDGWIEVISTPGLLSSKIALLKSESFIPLDADWISLNADAEHWIYNALRCIPNPINEQGESEERIVDTVNNLLCALYHNGIPPSKDNLELIVQLLSLQGSLSLPAAFLLLQENVHDWYMDLELGSKLRDYSVWASLSAIMVHHEREPYIKSYIDLAYLLSTIPEWQPHIQKELCSWIHIYSNSFTIEEYLEKYNVVFKTIWAPSRSIPTNHHFEEAVGLVHVALSDFWTAFDPATPFDSNSLLAWLECSNSLILHWNTEVWSIVQCTQMMMQELFIPLQRTLCRTVKQIQTLPAEARTPILVACQEILTILANTMSQTETGFDNSRDNIHNQIREIIKTAGNLVIT
ncbi:hypothetical protein R3P38DRAFT_2661874 [Favolaschia claudopus]|uniref:DUF6535 domain-containing protein n=1 Tax=Favolaschia claudopus TaxID=2862362 RepID=A0AAV9ZLH8_9AGAR